MASFLDKYINEFNQGQQGKLMGRPYDYWLDKIAPNEKVMADMMKDLVMNVGTLQRQGAGQAQELTAQYDLPVATQLALTNKSELQGQKAIQGGTLALEEYQDQAKRQAWGNIMGAEQNETQFQQQMAYNKEMQESQFWSDLLGTAGSVLGSYLLGPVGIGAKPVIEGTLG